MNKRGLRILVVDDEPDYCNVMKVILEANGHMVTCDTSGQAALATLAKKSFDLVITDLMMPEIDSRQLMAEIKERYPGVEVIILTAYEKGSFTGAMTRRIGRIETADSGTLFLDEIGDIPLSMQAKLLKAIETKRIYRMGSNEEIEVDFRLVSATNKNLAEEIAAERFREDFYYRISTIVIRIPPLRERKEDLPLLIDYFFKKSQNEMKKTINRIEPEVMDALLSYHYPGNIRELKNIIERIVVLSEDGVIQMDSFPAPMSAAGNDVKSMVPLAEEKSLREMRKEAETIYIENILKKYNYDMNKSAEVLGITRRQLLNKITEYGISRSEN